MTKKHFHWKQTPHYDWLQRTYEAKFGITEEIDHQDYKGFRAFTFSGSRYIFDDVLLDRGFKQYDTDQDAWYFGCWVHLTEFVTVSYAEGDISVRKYRNAKIFKKELQRMNDFYGDPPPAFVSLSSDSNGNFVRTNHYQPRPTME